MRCSLKRMLRTAGKKEPQGVVYQGVEDDMGDSKDSFKVPWAIGGREPFVVGLFQTEELNGDTWQPGFQKCLGGGKHSCPVE